MLVFSPGEFQHSMHSPDEKYDILDVAWGGDRTAKGDSAILSNPRFIPRRNT